MDVKRSTCRFCGHELKHDLVDLGLSPLANEYLRAEDISRGQRFYPLSVKVCDGCWLAQTSEYISPEDIFSDYKYFSSFSTSWLAHCEAYVDMIVRRLALGADSLVYEIACNDGYLLQYFRPHGVPVRGIEPAENVAEAARRKDIDVDAVFWGADTAAEIVATHGRADLIIGNNVLAHVPDINSFVEGVRVALKDGGTATFEFPHLLRLMEMNQFDTIYHEHFSYISLTAAHGIFKAHNMIIYDVEELPTHGGSLRIYAAHAGRTEQSDAVRQVLKDEADFGLLAAETYTAFGENVCRTKIEAWRTLSELKANGAKIAAFGAAAKGNTFLNYCGIGRETIDFVADSSTEKQGLYLPGSLIPIVSPKMIESEKPDYIIFLPWNLREELEKLLEYTRGWGTKFITFIPTTILF